MNKQLVMLSAVTLLIVASCKKITPEKVDTEVEKPIAKVARKCTLSGMLSSNGTVLPITFNQNGNLLTYTDGSKIYTYTYSSSEIRTEDANGVKIYQLDNKGRIQSEGGNKVYTYDAEGFLVETRRKAPSNTRLDLWDQYTWKAGNLIKIVETSTSSLDTKSITTTTIEYSTDTVPSNYYISNYNPIDSKLFRFLGKQPRNLVLKATITYSSGKNEHRYEYVKDDDGNIIKRTLYYNAGNPKSTRRYTYNCESVE